VTIRENINAALNGDTPDVTPLTFYSWMVTMEKKENEHLLFADQWKRLYDMGLGIWSHIISQDSSAVLFQVPLNIDK
jgi:hypothetical protein